MGAIHLILAFGADCSQGLTGERRGGEPKVSAAYPGVGQVGIADSVRTISIPAEEMRSVPARVWIQEREGYAGFPNIDDVHLPSLTESTFDAFQRVAERNRIVGCGGYPVADI